VQGGTLERCSADPCLPHHDLEVVIKARKICWSGDADQGNFLESCTVFARSRVTSCSKESDRARMISRPSLTGRVGQSEKVDPSRGRYAKVTVCNRCRVSAALRSNSPYATICIGVDQVHAYKQYIRTV
jgi:hypothetical protein